MRTYFENIENLITIRGSVDGNVYRTLSYNCKEYVEPYYTGDEIGWIKDILYDNKTRTYNCLIITADEQRVWLTIDRVIAFEFGLHRLEEHSPLYFPITLKKWHKSNTLPYRIYELSTYPRFFEVYTKPESLLAE